ncbi:MAG: nuclear transport factor 2 family protein [Sinimarinibacterium sp.]
MNIVAEDNSYIVDREKIRDGLARLARGEDRRDAAVLRGCYWPDATVDHGVFVGSFAEYLAWVVPGAPSIPVTLHTLGQSLIDLRGAIALVETHVTAYHRIDMGGQERDVVIGGRYLDRMEQRGREWRIAHRTMLYDWTRDFGPSADWSQGLLGMPFLTGHSVGSARGDHSETFFT